MLWSSMIRCWASSELPCLNAGVTPFCLPLSILLLNAFCILFTSTAPLIPPPPRLLSFQLSLLLTHPPLLCLSAVQYQCPPSSGEAESLPFSVCACLCLRVWPRALKCLPSSWTGTEMDGICSPGNSCLFLPSVSSILPSHFTPPFISGPYFTSSSFVSHSYISCLLPCSLFSFSLFYFRVSAPVPTRIHFLCSSSPTQFLFPRPSGPFSCISIIRKVCQVAWQPFISRTSQREWMPSSILMLTKRHCTPLVSGACLAASGWNHRCCSSVSFRRWQTPPSPSLYHLSPVFVQIVLELLTYNPQEVSRKRQ